VALQIEARPVRVLGVEMWDGYVIAPGAGRVLFSVRRWSEAGARNAAGWWIARNKE
jgi:hypothetical protein